MTNIRYTKKLKPFASRFSDDQRQKLTDIADKLDVSEAEVLRILVENHEL